MEEVTSLAQARDIYCRWAERSWSMLTTREWQLIQDIAAGFDAAKISGRSNSPQPTQNLAGASADDGESPSWTHDQRGTAVAVPKGKNGDA